MLWASADLNFSLLASKMGPITLAFWEFCKMLSTLPKTEQNWVLMLSKADIFSSFCDIDHSCIVFSVGKFLVMLNSRLLSAFKVIILIIYGYNFSRKTEVL